MNNIKSMLAGAAGIFAATIAFGTANEDATLNATIIGGNLEIVPASVNGPWAPVGGDVTASEVLQSDALVFNIDGINVNDLNGDGQGFILSAAPDATLLHTNNTDTIARGTVGGFTDPDAGGVVSTVTTTGDTLTYASGSGVNAYAVNYDVSYDVPAFAVAGDYSGVVAFSVVAN